MEELESCSSADEGADATERSSSSLAQPWVVAEESRRHAAPPLVDVRQFGQEWAQTLRPLSPEVDPRHGPPPTPSPDTPPDQADNEVLQPFPLDEDIHQPNLSCEDIFIGSSHQQIQAAIEREMEKEENKELLLAKNLSVNAVSAELMERANIPDAAHLVAEKEAASELLLSLKEKQESKEEAKARKKKQKRQNVNYLTPNMQTVDGPFEAIDPNEVVLSIAIYHHKKQLKTQEFLVLGSQKLSMLRDKIKCVSHLLPEPNSKSGYFFFENVFYDDMRDPNNIRYSTTVIEWADAKRAVERETTAMFQYTARLMEDTIWADLRVRVGVPYLYCHQGNCEHRVIITDIRLLTRDDERNIHAYPLRIFQSKIRRKKCVICDIYPATRLTYGDELSPQNPCFFCERCYRPFHYSFEGNLLRPYQVFDYHHE